MLVLSQKPLIGEKKRETEFILEGKQSIQTFKNKTVTNRI